MNDIKIIKAMQKEANKQFKSKFSERVTIKYDLKKANETNEAWTVGDTFYYQNVPCLRDTVSNVNFADNQTANIVVGKSNFFVPWSDYDFSNNQKRNVKIVDNNGVVFNIDKVLPMVPAGNNRFIFWMLVQK